MPGPTTFTGTMNMYPRSFRPAKRDPLLHQQWNNATSSLRLHILDVVSGADWTAIDILRVGLNEEFHNALLIAVAPDSIPWREGHSLALRCKTILEEHGIADMYCEIRKSVATLYADTPTTCIHISSAPATALNDFQLSSEPITDPHEKIKVELSDSLGTKIAMKDSDFTIGTKGLYLALPSTPEGESRIVALTCRHVVINSKTEGLQEYRYEHPQPHKEVIQVDQPNYGRIMTSLKTSAERYENTATKSSVRGQTHLAAVYNELSTQTKSLEQIMEKYRTPSSRIFGHLLYSPEFKCTSENGDAGLRD